jgi:hypothetical protein
MERIAEWGVCQNEKEDMIWRIEGDVDERK